MVDVNGAIHVGSGHIDRGAFLVGESAVAESVLVDLVAKFAR